MFTGIVEEVGEILAVEPLGNGRSISIGAVRVLNGLSAGDSISVDGACQTVTGLDASGFRVQAVATTLERTTFAALAPGRRVNLERALAVGGRLGGHLVQGHVDGTGEIRSIEEIGELILIDLSVPPEVSAVTVLHGSITVNGISLTVNALPAPGMVQLSIIPFTRDHTAIGELEIGDAVNLEGDLIGKYVRHLLGEPGSRKEGQDPSASWGY